MKLDRRITNGLAWTGALLVVAIPTADFISRQFMPDAAPRVGVVSDESVRQAALSSVQTGQGGSVTPAPAAAPVVEQVAQAQPTGSAQPATATNASGDPVDSFLQSGRKLPDYISGGASATPAATPSPAPKPAPTVAPQTTPAPAAPKPAEPAAVMPAKPATPAAPVAQPAAPAAPAATTPVATRPAIVDVPLPTPVSQRPPSVAAVNVRPDIILPPSQQPVIVRPQGNQVVRPEDLNDWENGPMNEFLANQQRNPRPVVRPNAPIPPAAVGQQPIVRPDVIVPPANVGVPVVRPDDVYVPGGFFLDQRPGSRQPSAPVYPYGQDYYEVYPLN